MRSLTLAVLLLASTALAGVPHKVGYQGLLLKNDGTPETGTLQFTFTIYDASSAGAPLWTETQQIMLAEGYYATQLGAVAIPRTEYLERLAKAVELERAF